MSVDNLEASACREHISCIFERSCYIGYNICVLKQRGYLDNENNINEAMYKLMNESNIGYVFESEDERKDFLDVAKRLNKMDRFVTRYCYEFNQVPWDIPLHPNIYCPKGQMPGVTVQKFCIACPVFCSTPNATKICTVLKTGKSGDC